MSTPTPPITDTALEELKRLHKVHRDNIDEGFLPNADTLAFEHNVTNAFPALLSRIEAAESKVEMLDRMGRGLARDNERLQSSLTQAEGENGRLLALLQTDQPWTIWHIINSLCDAVDFAFHKYDMRPDGWEAWSHNAKVGREIAAKLEEAVYSTPPSVGREDWQAAAFAERITQYLSVGGFFNPEFMEHDKVRDLLIEIRDYLKPDSQPVREGGGS